MLAVLVLPQWELERVSRGSYWGSIGAGSDGSAGGAARVTANLVSGRLPSAGLRPSVERPARDYFEALRGLDQDRVLGFRIQESDCEDGWRRRFSWPSTRWSHTVGRSDWPSEEDLRRCRPREALVWPVERLVDDREGEPADLVGCWLGAEDAECERGAGEGVEYAGDREGEQSEEPLTWVMSRSHMSLGPRALTGILSGLASRRASGGKPDRGSCRYLRTLSRASRHQARARVAAIVPAPFEAQPVHGLDQVSDDIGVSANRRSGLEEGADRVLAGLLACLYLPAKDRPRRDAEQGCRFVSGEGEQPPDLEDPPSLMRRVVRTPSLG